VFSVRFWPIVIPFVCYKMEYFMFCKTYLSYVQSHLLIYHHSKKYYIDTLYEWFSIRGLRPQDDFKCFK